MSNKQQTAADWLEVKVNAMIEKGGDADLLAVIEHIKQAKEMDKQQKIDTYNQGKHNGQTNWGCGNDITAEQYYKETYEQ